MALHPRSEAFLKLIERRRVPAKLKVTGTRFSYRAEAAETVPGILVRPTNSARRAPVVIALHGTGSNKDSMLPLMNDLARRGCLAVAIDGRHHGERANGKSSSAAYQEAILHAWRTGMTKPFLYDTVWDVMRLIDAIGNIDGADPERVGLIGISKGGMEGYLAAAVDERLKAVVPCIAAQSFRWGVENNAWHARVSTFQTAFDTAAKDAQKSADGEFLKAFYSRVAPGILAEFDGPAMLPLIAPRGLYLINGELDPRCPLPGLEECLAALKVAYKDVPDRLHYLIQPQTAHRVNANAMAGAVEWISHYL